MKRVGLIGCGTIGRAVARALLQGSAGRHALAGVLVRSARELDGFPLTGDAQAFYAQRYDLVLEAGGPAAFRANVVRALAQCDVWAVSPLPLADPALEREVRAACAASGHALRIAPGALAGLDGIATAMAGGIERLEVFVDLGPGENTEPRVLFEGSVREAAMRHPEGINVAIAAALAGPGLDATRVRVMQPPRGAVGRVMGYRVSSRVGSFEVISRPRIVPAEDTHPAGASLIAMLRREAAGILVA